MEKVQKKQDIGRANSQKSTMFERFFADGSTYTSLASVDGSVRDLLASLPNSNKNPVIVVKHGKVIFMNTATLVSFPSIEKELLSHSIFADMERITKGMFFGGSYSDEIRVGVKSFQRFISVNGDITSIFLVDVSRVKAAESMGSRHITYPMNNPHPLFEIKLEPFSIVGVNKPAKALFPSFMDNKREHALFANLDSVLSKLSSSKRYQDIVTASSNVFVRDFIAVPLKKMVLLYATDITALVDAIRKI